MFEHNYNFKDALIYGVGYCSKNYI